MTVIAPTLLSILLACASNTNLCVMMETQDSVVVQACGGAMIVRDDGFTNIVDTYTTTTPTKTIVVHIIPCGEGA